jgi:FAD/FMN-containing dehydrogenase
MTAEVRQERPIPRAALDDLARELGGKILVEEDDGFAEATLIWNAMITKTPGAVVQPTSVEDVVATVNFARENHLELSIKGGGHNIAGLALSDGGVTLDFSLMRQVDVDAQAGTASVQPGCKLGDVDRATQAHGLAVTLGFVSETGVGGLTLGGGFGYLTRQFGWSSW